MSEEAEFGAGKPRGIDNRCMDQLIEDEDVFLADQRGDRTERGGVAGRKGKRGFGGIELSQGRLELVVGRHGTADEPRGAGAGAKVAHGPPHGFLEGGMSGEAQVVVRREVQKPPAVDEELRALGRIDPAQGAVQALGAQVGQFVLQNVIERVHPRTALWIYDLRFTIYAACELREGFAKAATCSRLSFSRITQASFPVCDQL